MNKSIEALLREILKRHDGMTLYGSMDWGAVRRVLAEHDAQPAAQPLKLVWPVKGVRVDDDCVLIKVRGGNDAARWLCKEIIDSVDWGAK